MYSPTLVNATVRPLRSNIGIPMCLSSSRTCMVTAGGVRCKVCADLAKLRFLATSLKTLRWRKVVFFIK